MTYIKVFMFVRVIIFIINIHIHAADIPRILQIGIRIFFCVWRGVGTDII